MRQTPATPFEKWVDQPISVAYMIHHWSGRLVDFGPGWLEIEAGGDRTVIHTGAGVSVWRLAGDGEEK